MTTMWFRLRHLWNKVFWFFAKPIRTVYRFLVRPAIRSTKVLIFNDTNILLARPNYGQRKWSVPGGAVERGETFEEGARRELFEETNIAVERLEYIGEYQRFIDYTYITSHVFLARVDSPDFTVDGIEIKEARWFPIDALPTDRGANVDRIIGIYKLRLHV